WRTLGRWPTDSFGCALAPPPLSCAERSPSPLLRNGEDVVSLTSARYPSLQRRRRPMTKQELIARMQEGQAWVPGKRVKIDFGGDQGAVMLDGAAGDVSEENGAADTTIKVGWDDWQQLAAGQMDGMTAFMMGKLRVEGDMSNAMQLQGVLA